MNYGLAMIWVCESLNANKLLLNTGKSNLVIFHSYQRKANINANLRIFDNDYFFIENVTFYCCPAQKAMLFVGENYGEFVS